MEVSRDKVQPPEQVQAAKRAQASQQAARRETKVEEKHPPPSKEAERKPVVNSQGQTIGTRLNVAA